MLQQLCLGQEACLHFVAGPGREDFCVFISDLVSDPDETDRLLSEHWTKTFSRVVEM